MYVVGKVGFCDAARVCLHASYSEWAEACIFIDHYLPGSTYILVQ